MSATIRRISSWGWVYFGLAVVAFFPFLISSPGRISVDTKLPLFLNPADLLANAAYLWDPQYASGTVTHQNIGYLFPMGPFFWFFDLLGTPDWLAQRLWFGSLVFLAGLGVIFLFRTLYRRDVGCVAAALLYMLSPYLLVYISRQSVILLPWVGLPWLLALTERSLRRPTWRDPALFALVTFMIGGTNATALIFVAVAPILWIVYRLTGPDRISIRQSVSVIFRIGVLVLATSTWWLAGLLVQKDFGVPVLDFTETVRAVSAASSPLESLRGLGNWFFYGRDGLESWIVQSVQYQESIGLLIATLITPIIAVVLTLLIRWRHRFYFVGLILLGTSISVGAYPYDDPSIFGRLFKSFAEGSSFGLALRSTPRAVPLVVLGIAVLIGAGISALSVARPRVGMTAAVMVGLLAVINLAPLGQGDLVSDNLSRPSEIPKSWTQAANYLDKQSSSTRVLEIPGQDFGFSRWGATVDPLLPELTGRPWTGRELVPYGSLAAADILIALDRRIQEGVLEPEAVAPIARLFAAGDVVVRNDSQYERFRTARPRYLENLFTPTPSGLNPETSFGSPKVNLPDRRQPVRDPEELSDPTVEVASPSVQVFGVKKPQKIVRTAPTGNPVVLSGDGEGIVDAASAGIINGQTLVFESATFARQKTRLRRLVAQDADLVITDTNRRRVRHWGSIRDMTGYTERAGETALSSDPGDSRLSPFTDISDSHRTVVIGQGVRWVRADRYGDPVRLTPEERPAAAIDGDLATGWREGAGVDATGARIVIDLTEAVTADHISLVQLQNGELTRAIKKVKLQLDDNQPRIIALGPESLSPAGQRIDFPRQSFSRVNLTVAKTTSDQAGVSAVGIAEVVIPEVTAVESVRLPTDLLRTVGEKSIDHRLTLLMNRLRGSQREYLRSDEEPVLARTFSLPTSRTFTVSGTARLNGNSPDLVIDSTLGANLSDGQVTASSHLEGDPKARAFSAFDSDPTTAWSPAFLAGNTGQWVEASFPTPLSIDHLDVVVLADDYHSIPVRLTVTPKGGSPFVVDVPRITASPKRGTTKTARIDFPVITTDQIRVTVDAVKSVTTPEYFSRAPQELPVGIIEIGVPGFTASPLPATIADECRTDLLTIDGQALPVQITGDAKGALNREGLSFAACSETPLSLKAGVHEIRSANGLSGGLDIDTLSLASDKGGGPNGTVLLGNSGGQQTGPRLLPRSVSGNNRAYDLKVESAGSPFWLVLSQSANAGWRVESDHGATVGERTLVNGMANAWLVKPDQSGTTTLQVSWTPQNRIWVGIAITIVGLLACLVLIFRRRKPLDTYTRANQASPIWSTRVFVSPSTLSRAKQIAISVGLGVIGLALGPVWLGVVVGLATFGAMRNNKVLYCVRIAAVGALVIAAGFVVIQQWRYGYEAAYDWPQHFLRLNELPWLSLLLLLGSVIADQSQSDSPLAT